MPDPGQLEALLRRDRLLVCFCLAAAALIAVIYILTGAGMGMTAMQMSVPMQHMGAVEPSSWSLSYGFSMFLMWWVMMIAMMLPSAVPTILLATALNRRSQAEVPPYGSTAAFTSGYLLAWGAFSLAAVALQWWLEQSRMLSMHMESVNTYFTAGLLIAAGAWQMSPIKDTCLRHCRSPIDFLTRHRRPGATGALYMGAHHGIYCLGCCWFLMALLFVGGVMNLYWIVGLAVYVFAEKTLRIGPLLSRLLGVVLIIWGLKLIWGS